MLSFLHKKGFRLIDPEEIVYCQAEGNYTQLFLTNKRTQLITIQLEQIEPKLDGKLFVRVSRSYLINIRYMKVFDRKRKVVEMKGEDFPELKVLSSG